MLCTPKKLSSLVLLAAFSLPIASIGCAEHREGRYYDPYYNDYHNWGPDEQTYYRTWYGQNYHDQYRDYRKLNRDEQNKYWQWRHAQSGHAHDRDHDRDHDKH